MKNTCTKAACLLFVLLCMAQHLSAQLEVAGKVTDNLGEPLIGVSILVKGTTTGTITDYDGAYTLMVPGESGTLIYSYTGFKTEEREVTTSTNNLDLMMEDDIAKLDEVVVTGLASGVKRSNSGNSVTTISGDELMDNTNPQTLDNALYGKIPGVQMTSNSGAPGGGINVQLRGISTLGAGSSQPLYIIDGVYVNNETIRTGRTQVNGASGGQSAATQDDASNRIADINPNDIERIEVLKGPSAAAIYGTRANAGVIIITTKKGQAGETSISISQDIGFAKGQNFQGFDTWDRDKVDFFFGGDADELAALSAAESEGRVTDWEDFFYGETPLLSNTQVKVSGGSQKTQFFISGGLLSEDGIIKNTGFDRYSLRANITHALSDRVRVSLNSNYLKSENDRGFTGNQNNTGGSIGYALAYTPSYANLFPNAEGIYPDNPYFNDNPIAIRDLGINNQKVDRFLTAANIDVDLLQATNTFLKLKINGGVDYTSGNSLVYFPEVLQHQRASANPGDVMRGRDDNLNSNIQAFLTLNTNLGTINSNTSIGGVRLDQSSDFLLMRGRGLSGLQTNLGWAKVVSRQAQIAQTVTDIGLVAQQDFNWEDKLIASLGIRFDKSTLNRDQDKFYAFPKVSLAANLTNFDFWTADIVDQFKLRAAYGETGGLPNFGNTFESLVPQLVGGVTGGQVSTRGVDENLEPETASEIEFGLDAALLDERISLTATYYVKEVRDLIFDLTPAESTGFLAIATNAADLENKGFELGLGIAPVRNDRLDWFAQINFWKNTSEITDLRIPIQTVGGFGPSLGTYLIAEGFSPTTIVGLPSGTDVPGGFTVYGDRQPDFTLVFSNYLSFFKNFDFSFVLHHQNGGEAINLSALLWDDGGTTPNWFGDDDNDETVNGIDRISEWAGGNTSVYIEPTSYLKLREAGLYYTIPESVLGSSWVNKIRLGVSTNNVLLWTNYGSYDPEVSNFGSQPITSNIEVTPYPSSRRFFFHFNLDF